MPSILALTPTYNEEIHVLINNIKIIVFKPLITETLLISNHKDIANMFPQHLV